MSCHMRCMFNNSDPPTECQTKKYAKPANCVHKPRNRRGRTRTSPGIVRGVMTAAENLQKLLLHSLTLFVYWEYSMKCEETTMVCGSWFLGDAYGETSRKSKTGGWKARLLLRGGFSRGRQTNERMETILGGGDAADRGVVSAIRGRAGL